MKKIKKTLWIAGVMLFIMVLTLIFAPSILKGSKDSGTCCPQQFSKCVVGGKDFDNYYFKEEGPC